MIATEKHSSLEITVKGLGKRFNREWIFRNLNYTFKSGTTYAITGPNGSGKSTLLQVLWGQLPQTTGDLYYQNEGAQIPVEEIFKRLTIATPYLDLIEELTLSEHIRFHFKLKHSRNQMSEGEVLERMKLSHARNKHIANFSSGMKQRVKLGLAFFTEADLIFLDEPTTNLDREATAWYHQQRQELPQHCTVFIASNQPDEYPASATTISILSYK